MEENIIRTKDEWLKEFDATMPKCKWFIEKYFVPELYEQLLFLAKEKNVKQLIFELDDIWFRLPDSFNIVNRPDGWMEFLSLVEFYNEEERLQISM